MTIEELAVEVNALKAELAALRAEVRPVVDSHAPNPPGVMPPRVMAMLPAKE